MCICGFGVCDKSLVSIKNEKLVSFLEWYIKRFELRIFLGKLLVCYFFDVY